MKGERDSLTRRYMDQLSIPCLVRVLERDEVMHFLRPGAYVEFHKSRGSRTLTDNLYKT